MNLVTGGAGFIGSHLAARLAARGETVRILDNHASGRTENPAAISSQIELIRGDVRDPDAVRRACAGVRVVFHEAAEISVPRSLADPMGTYDVNVTGTLNLLIAARDAGCGRLVFASSAAVYGDAPKLPKNERMELAPRSPYAASKLAGEELCRLFDRVYGIETVALRYFNVFGPGQNPDSPYAAVIPRVVAALQRGEQPVIYGDGEQSRDFVHVDDVVEANLRAAAAPGVSGMVFNVATGRAVTVNAVLSEIGRATGVEITPRHEPHRPGDIRHSWADVEAARSGLGFSASITFAEGVRRMLRAGVGPAGDLATART